MLKVGLTGGIGVGKSYVCKIFTELGCYVFDADQVARDVVNPGKLGYEKVVAEFGQEILASDGTIDRARLGQIVFNDKAKREKLNELLHPIIIEEQNKLMIEVLAKDPQAIVIMDAALMIESGSYKRFDKLIVVFCDQETQIERVMKRNNFSHDQAQARINTQMSTEEKRRYADIEIDTSGGYEKTDKRVQEVYEELQALAGEIS
jgi:dephospho-CoA kinase